MSPGGPSGARGEAPGLSIRLFQRKGASPCSRNGLSISEFGEDRPLAAGGRFPGSPPRPRHWPGFVARLYLPAPYSPRHGCDAVWYGSGCLAAAAGNWSTHNFMTTPCRVSVVIPTYERCALVQRALRALSQQTLSPDEYEVVVSIDGSQD